MNAQEFLWKFGPDSTDVMAAMQDNGDLFDVSQDWEKETTVVSFHAGGTLRISGPFVDLCD